MNPVQLSRTEHADLRINPGKAQAEAAAVHLVPLSRIELRQASRCFPLFFAKDLETGQFYPAALLGLRSGENLFWDGSSFEADYIPLNIRRLPFFLGRDDSGQETVCMDSDSAAIDPAGPERIIEDDGSESKYIKDIQAMLAALSQQHEATREFAANAARLGLLSEIKLDIVLEDGEPIKVEGLYGIDDRVLEQKLGTITGFEDKTLVMAMMLSLDHVGGLVRRKNSRNAEFAAWQAPAKA